MGAELRTDETAAAAPTGMSGSSQVEMPLLCEVAWEVCQQLGGIYTVVRSKVPSMVKQWGRNYCLVGPYDPQLSPVEFEPATPAGPFGNAVKALNKAGFEAHYGHWLITGRPAVVLLNPQCVYRMLAEIKYLIWEHHGISLLVNDPLIDRVLAFGFLSEEFFRILCEQEARNRPLIAHFHEWMAATAIPAIRRRRLPLAVVFTTHATLLGRYLASNDPYYYDHVPHTDWAGAASHYNIEPQVQLERAAAHGAHVFTTVSEVTAFECQHLIGRTPDMVLPNGLNVERFVALHEFQNLHRLYKEKINQFVMGHFFPSYTFDLDKTLYFFISGRYEYTNKGFDLAIEAMARLNWRMKQVKLDRTIVFFIITRGAYRSVNAEVLRTRALMEEIRSNCEAIKDQIGSRLFLASAMGKTPLLDELVDDYWRLRLRRNLQAWRTQRLPLIVTHDMVDDANDPILRQLRYCNLLNWPEDPVKVVFHPDFVSSTDPLFGMDYDQFVRGCHFGIFPSLYEPWGYAPLECVVLGIPSISSDTAGFGAYVARCLPDHEERGIMVIRRRHVSFDESANEIAEKAFKFAQMGRRERIALRNRVESTSERFDWHNLVQHYREAHELALQRSAEDRRH